MTAGLRRAWPRIQGQTTYGGSQRLDPYPVMVRCGCGVIAALDTLLYLHLHRPGCACALFRGAPENGEIPGTLYFQWADLLRRRYFPVLPPLGLNGWTLCAGLNRFFRDTRLPLRASWGALHQREALRMQLREEFPAILAVGAALPGRALPLYTRKEGQWVPERSVRSHFVTVTAMDDAWLTVSSWGRQYGIRLAEYERYVRTGSGPFLSNLLVLRDAETGEEKQIKSGCF